jgi:hypothetical protein
MPGLREKALALLSAFASGAIVGCFPLLAILAFRGDGPPLEDRDLIAGAIFVGLSLVTVAIVLRAIFRKQRGAFFDASRLRESPEAHGVQALVGQAELVGLARLAGVVALIGLAAGLWAGWRIRTQFVERLLLDAESWCGSRGPLGFSEEPQCVEVARGCIREGWTLPATRLSRVASLREVWMKRRQAEDAAATEAARTDGWYSDRAVREVSGLIDQLKDSTESPKLAQARQAAVVCLAEAGGVVF